MQSKILVETLFQKLFVQVIFIVRGKDVKDYKVYSVNK